MRLISKPGHRAVSRGRQHILMAVCLGLGLLSFTACSKPSGSAAQDAGANAEIDTDVTAEGDDEIGQDIRIDTEVRADTTTDPDNTAADGDTDAMPDTGTDAASETNTDDVPETGTDATPDTGDVEEPDQGTALGPGAAPTGFGVSSGAAVGESTNYLLHAFVGGGPISRGRSANYQLTAGTGVLTQP